MALHMCGADTVRRSRTLKGGCQGRLAAPMRRLGHKQIPERIRYNARKIVGDNVNGYRGHGALCKKGVGMCARVDASWGGAPIVNTPPPALFVNETIRVTSIAL
jgi:hypothetical protein